MADNDERTKAKRQMLGICIKPKGVGNNGNAISLTGCKWVGVKDISVCCTD